MSYQKFFRALLDKDVELDDVSSSPEVLLRSILFSKEFFELHAPYLRKRDIADDDVLMKRSQFYSKKTTIGVKYVKDLIATDGDEFIRGTYRLFLDREPDIGGFQVYKEVLKTSGKGQVLRAIISSEEAASRARDVVILNETYSFVKDI